MPKIPTFTAKGSIEQLAGTTSNIQMGLNNTLASALAPVTEAVVNFKIKENDVQNRTEALKLKNDYLSESVLLEDQINQDKNLSINKEAANIFLKEKTNALMEKYAALATTQTSKTMFTNSALADVSKQIFSVDAEISNNILVQADEVFIDAKEKLFSKAYLKGGIYKKTLQADTEQLIIDSYKSRAKAVELEIMLGNVKGEIDYFDGMQDVQQTPRAAFYALKDEKNYSDITTKQRFALIERASVVIREQLTTEWENNLAMRDAGKEPPEFNMKLAQEVFGGEIAEKMLQQESVRKDAVENTSLIMTSPQKNVNELVKNIIDEQYEMFGETQAKKNQTYYESILAKRNEDLIKDPVKLIRNTNDYIDSLFEEIQNNTDNPESRSKSQKILAQELIKEQKRLDVLLSNQKVMSNSAAEQFVIQFKELGFDGNSKARTAMLKSLDFQYGNLSDKALTQLMTAGLPKGTKVGLVLGTEQTINEFMSFDDPKEVEALTNFLARQDDTDISLEKIKTAIVNQSDYGDIYNINRQNVPFDISGTITEMDEITDVLSLYAAKLMFGNPGMSVSAASKEASLLFSNNYRVEDTYFLPRKIDGRDINDRELDTHVKILDTIKYNYLPTFEAVAFKSNREDVSSKELTEKMNYNLINNGEWRNSADGEGSVYGIVLSNNSFGIVVNENGEELFVKHGDNSYTLPGSSGIEIDINLPTEQEKKQYRGYYGYAEKIKQESNNLDSDGNFIGGKRENLDNNKMQNALEQSGASTVEISNVFSTAAEASEIDLSQKYNKLPNLEPVKQEWLLTTAKKVFDINKDEIIPSDIILAINSGETGYGTSRFFKEGSNNLFNIQTFNKNTPHIKAKDSDQMIKKYNTVEDSIIDFLSMVKTSKKYKKVREQIKLFNEGKGSKDKIIDAIAATGFAEDEKWSSKTKSILKKRINGKHKNELSNLK
jgi:flagellum-specific peptidoglycan hydrolase FlgJ